MSNPNNAVPVEPIKIPVKLPKIKMDKPSVFTKDNFLTALVLSMGAFLTKAFIANHSLLLADKKYELAHKLLLISGLEFLAVLGLFLGYTVASKIKK